jgi:hypothetical protein
MRRDSIGLLLRMWLFSGHSIRLLGLGVRLCGLLRICLGCWLGICGSVDGGRGGVLGLMHVDTARGTGLGLAVVKEG